jgi:hypothetical protein
MRTSALVTSAGSIHVRLSVGAFCAREGYSQTRLRYWSERLGHDSVVRPQTVSFVPVTLGRAHQRGHIEIERSGVVVRVREDLDVEHIARLVAALAVARQPC